MNLKMSLTQCSIAFNTLAFDILLIMQLFFKISDKVSGGQFSIIVKTYGTVKYQNRKSKTFHQNFMLTSQNNVWKVVSDSFRFQD